MLVYFFLSHVKLKLIACTVDIFYVCIHNSFSGRAIEENKKLFDVIGYVCFLKLLRKIQGIGITGNDAGLA